MSNDKNENGHPFCSIEGFFTPHHSATNSNAEDVIVDALSFAYELSRVASNLCQNDPRMHSLVSVIEQQIHFAQEALPVAFQWNERVNKGEG